MNNILSLETTTDVCSVALERKDGALFYVEDKGVNIHSARLNNLIRSVIDDSSVRFSELDVIAISKGPGSYTGLRIGVSTAKGLCFASDIPLIGINTLQSMVQDARISVLENYPAINIPELLFCPMLDARRMEVYDAVFDHDGNFVRETHAEVVDSEFMHPLLKTKRIVFFGNGLEKCRSVLEKNPNAICLPEFIYPKASQLIPLAKKRFATGQTEDIFTFEPFYLKDFYSPQLKG